jgi:hypothetical protein
VKKIVLNDLVRSVGEDEENMVLMQKASTTMMMMMMMMMGCGGGGARERGKDHPRAYVKITTNKQNNVSRHVGSAEFSTS